MWQHWSAHHVKALAVVALLVSGSCRHTSAARLQIETTVGHAAQEGASAGQDCAGRPRRELAGCSGTEGCSARPKLFSGLSANVPVVHGGAEPSSESSSCVRSRSCGGRGWHSRAVAVEARANSRGCPRSHSPRAATAVGIPAQEAAASRSAPCGWCKEALPRHQAKLSRCLRACLPRGCLTSTKLAMLARP